MIEKRNHKGAAAPDARKRGSHCPFVTDPWDQCFITGVSSRDVELAIYYCGEYFEECEIYRRRTRRGEP